MTEYLQELQREANLILRGERRKREMALEMARPALEQARDILTRLGLEPEPDEDKFGLVFWYMGHRGTVQYSGGASVGSSAWCVQSPQYPGVPQVTTHGVTLRSMPQVLFKSLLEIAVREARKKEKAEVHGEPAADQQGEEPCSS